MDGAGSVEHHTEKEQTKVPDTYCVQINVYFPYFVHSRAYRGYLPSKYPRTLDLVPYETNQQKKTTNKPTNKQTQQTHRQTTRN